jgi:hypothetical protein
LGDLLADALGFFGGGTGHHSGGQSLHKWCLENAVHPTALYIAWIEGARCHRCLETRLCNALRPKLNRNAPARCGERA